MSAVMCAAVRLHHLFGIGAAASAAAVRGGTAATAASSAVLQAYLLSNRRKLLYVGHVGMRPTAPMIHGFANVRVQMHYDQQEANEQHRRGMAIALKCVLDSYSTRFAVSAANAPGRVGGSTPNPSPW